MNFLVAPGAWTLDVVFIVVLIVGITIGSWRGFIKSVCKIAGTIFAGIIAAGFCTPFGNTIGLTAALAEKVEPLWGGILSVVISAIALFALVKLGAWLLGKFGTAILERSNAMRRLNRLLGALLGLLEALTILLLLLGILKWINADAVNEFMNTTYIVKYIYNWDWFSWAMHLPFLKQGE